MSLLLKQFTILRKSMKTSGGVVNEYAMLYLLDHPEVNSGWVSTDVGNRLDRILQEDLEKAIRRFVAVPEIKEVPVRPAPHVFPVPHLHELREALARVSGVRSAQIEQIGEIQARICPGTGYRSRRSRAAARAVRDAYRRAEPVSPRRFDYEQKD